MEELKRAKDAVDAAAKNLGKMAGSGPLNTRRASELKYKEAHERYVSLLKQNGIEGYMYPKAKYRGR